MASAVLHRSGRVTARSVFAARDAHSLPSSIRYVSGMLTTLLERDYHVAGDFSDTSLDRPWHYARLFPILSGLGADVGNMTNL